MAEQTLALRSIYKGWETYQELLLHVVEPLSLDQLSLRAGQRLRSIGENAAHIVATRAGWLYYNLGRGDENMVALASWNRPDQPDLTAAELDHGLQATWQVIQDTLNQWTIADLAAIVHDTNDNGEVHTLTRQWVIWHLIEHDMQHGGELSFTLGMHGLPGIQI